MTAARWVGAVLVWVAAAAGTAAAQSMDIVPATEQATVGDPIELRVRIHLSERDALLDSMPALDDPSREGIRVLWFSGFSRGGDRVLAGTMRIALYRPGRQVIPVFSIHYRRNLVVPRATLTSEPVGVDIVPVLDDAMGSLRDLRDPARRRGAEWLPLALAAAAIAAAGVMLRRRRSRAARAAPPAPVEPPPRPRTPLEIALDRLAEIELDELAARGAVDRHYEEVGNVVRDYLEAAEDVRARERTTSELAWGLPPHLTDGGMRTRFLDLLGDADLVKFARVRREPAEAARFTEEARSVLERWGSASPPARPNRHGPYDRRDPIATGPAGPRDDAGES